MRNPLKQKGTTVGLSNAGGSISELTSPVPLAPMDDDERTADFTVQVSPRARSDSTSSHKRGLSGSLFSKLSFLRMNQNTPRHPDMQDDDDLRSGIPHNPGESHRAMSTAMAHRRTRRRRGSLRKTALLGTRLEFREKRASAKADARVDKLPPSEPTHLPNNASHAPKPEPAPDLEPEPLDKEDHPPWFRANANKPVRPSITRRRHGLVTHTFHSEKTATDDEDLVSFPRINTDTPPASSSKNTNATLHISNATANTEPFYLAPDTAYRPAHRSKSSPLVTHPVEMKSSPDVDVDYSETEWWGWIILAVTWLVFVVGIGSCFEVWSWAWDVGETPYAPPELEDDPTLPIVGYYPALIILTAVMSWVWVVVAWIGMKYFKHANISGEDI